MFLIADDRYSIRKTDKKGRGVFAAHIIEPGIVIGDYLGTVLDPKLIDAEDDKYHEELFYAQITDHQAILPDKTDKGVHLINHSCEPNIAFWPYNGHILYVSLRRIYMGEELTVNYLIDPEVGERNFFICHCGAPTCRGTWYIHPKKIAQFEKIFDKAASRQSDTDRDLPFGATLPKLNAYPKHVDDDPFYDLFGSAQEPPIVRGGDTHLPPISVIRQIIRETGKQICYDKMNIQIRGVMDNLIVATTGSTP